MAISRISIENIRGFDKVDLTVDLLPNFTNIIVAPNGFGKSTISKTFACARGSKLEVEEKDKHKNQHQTPSTLSIETGNKILVADSTKNEISQNFDINVIKSNIEPKAKLPKYNGVTVARPYLEIPSIDLGPSRNKAKLSFDLSKYKSLMGNNSKLVLNLANRCENEGLRSDLLEELGSIDKLSQKKYRDFFFDLIEAVKSCTGSRTSISNAIETNLAHRIDELPNLRIISDIINKFLPEVLWVENAIVCYILMDLITIDRTNLKQWLQYGAYRRRLQYFDKFITDINGAWVTAEIKETKGRVVVAFPDANSLSNGQRDLLYFGCSLLRTLEIDSRKPCILIIDEVFDYLDDANIVVAQYFLSNLIELYRKSNKDIYIYA